MKKARDEHRAVEHHIDAVARLQYYMASRNDGAATEEAAVMSSEGMPDGDEDGVEAALEAMPEPVDIDAPEESTESVGFAGPPEAVAVAPMTIDVRSEGVRAELDKAPSEVAAMFDRVAKRYDLVNDLLAVGQTRIWRGMTLRAVAPGPGERILDLAAGTGTSSAPFAAHGAAVVPCDFSIGMLEVGKRRQPELPFVAGDALNLPFRDGVFDAVTISFGLRNVQDTGRALREMLRVTKPGGRLVICEFSSPTNGFIRKIYSEYLMKALPAIARRTSSNPAAYVYLAESITAWPDQRHLADVIADAGWVRPQWRNATGGIVAIHRAYKAG